MEIENKHKTNTKQIRRKYKTNTKEIKTKDEGNTTKIRNNYHGSRPRREAERIIWAVGELPWVQNHFNSTLINILPLLDIFPWTTLRMNGCKRYSMLGCSIRDQTLIDVVPITWTIVIFFHSKYSDEQSEVPTSFFDPSFLFLSITFTRISSV